MTNWKPTEIELLVHALEEAFDDGYDRRSHRQTRLGLSLTPAERLRWLDATMATIRRLQGSPRIENPIAGGERSDQKWKKT